jgi:hypothetical protein
MLLLQVTADIIPTGIALTALLQEMKTSSRQTLDVSVTGNSLTVVK